MKHPLHFALLLFSFAVLLIFASAPHPAVAYNAYRGVAAGNSRTCTIREGLHVVCAERTTYPCCHADGERGVK